MRTIYAIAVWVNIGCALINVALGLYGWALFNLVCAVCCRETCIMLDEGNHDV